MFEERYHLRAVVTSYTVSTNALPVLEIPDHVTTNRNCRRPVQSEKLEFPEIHVGLKIAVHDAQS